MNDNSTQSAPLIPKETDWSAARDTPDNMIPRDLTIVASLFLVFGVLSAIDMIEKLSGGMLAFNFGVLGVPIFFGLFKLRNGWRICALVFIWIGLIVCLIVFVLGFVCASGYVNIGTIKLSPPGWVVSIVVILPFLLLLWLYRVLTRPTIKSLFLRDMED